MIVTRISSLCLLSLLFLLIGCGGDDKTQPAADAGGQLGADTKPAWPAKAINIVCADSADGDTTVFLQTLASALVTELGVEVSVTHVGSSSDGAARQQVEEAEHDGQTWLGMSDEMLIAARNGLTNVNLADWEFTIVARSPGVISVPANSRTPKLQNVIREAKREDSEVTFSAGETGGIWHAKLAALGKASKATLQHRNFPGTGPSRLAALSGQVTAVLTSLEDQLGDIKAGKLKPLATVDPRPSTVPGIGEIASAADLYPGIEDDPVHRFVGVAVPADVPAGAKARIGTAIGKALNDNAVVSLANKRYWHLDGTTGDQAKELVTAAAGLREELFASLEKREDDDL